MILFFNKCCDATWNLPWFFANCRKRLETGAWHYFKSALLSVKHDCFILQKTYGLDSENCSEISALTQLGICLSILTFPTFVLFTPPLWGGSGRKRWCGFCLPHKYVSLVLKSVFKTLVLEEEVLIQDLGKLKCRCTGELSLPIQAKLLSLSLEMFDLIKAWLQLKILSQITGKKKKTK